MEEQVKATPKEVEIAFEKRNSIKKITKKLFINNLDSYHGRAVLETLTSSNDVESRNESIESILGEEKICLKPKNEVLYEIYGTLEDKNNRKRETIPAKILNFKDKNSTETILSCDIIIFDISTDVKEVNQAMLILTRLEESFKTMEPSKKTNKKYFILISTLMTWAETIPADLEIQNNVINEDNYRKRRAHPLYSKHLYLEREIINSQKRYEDFIRTVVVCPGVTYGGQQNIFHYLYKMVYQNVQVLPIIEPANNYVPLIYIKDFAKIIKKIITKFTKKSKRYILAAQPNPITLESFARGITGEDVEIKISSKDELISLQQSLINQQIIDYCSLNFIVESNFCLNHNFTITGDNFDSFSGALVKEFKSSRGIEPLKIIIDGPPCSGKSTLAKQLSKFYEIPLINIEQFLTAKQDSLTELSSEVIKSEEDEIDSSDIEVTNKSLEPEENHESVETYFGNLIQKLSTKDCSENQGYILDGFPFNSRQASQILLEENEWNKKVKPDFVIILDGSNKILYSRAMKIEESLAILTKNTEKEMIKRLEVYRENNQEDTSVLNFFMDRNILPLEIKILKETSSEEICEQVVKLIGEPRIYPKSKKELERLRKMEKENERKLELERKALREEMARQEVEKRQIRLREWAEKCIENKIKEQEDLEVKSLPLRHYLMRHVLPSLTDGLVQVAKLKPNDGVDFLAEYLLRNNEAPPTIYETSSTSGIDSETLSEDYISSDSNDNISELFIAKTTY